MTLRDSGAVYKCTDYYYYYYYLRLSKWSELPDINLTVAQLMYFDYSGRYLTEVFHISLVVFMSKVQYTLPRVSL